MGNLIDTITKNGEYKRYEDMLEDRQDQEIRDLKRRAKELQRLKLADDYVSDPNEPSEPLEVKSSTSSLCDQSITSDEPKIKVTTEITVTDISVDEPDYPKPVLKPKPAPPKGFPLLKRSICMRYKQPDTPHTQELRDQISASGATLFEGSADGINEKFNPLRFLAMNLKGQNLDKDE